MVSFEMVLSEITMRNITNLVSDGLTMKPCLLSTRLNTVFFAEKHILWENVLVSEASWRNWPTNMKPRIWPSFH